jgi:hypothetical protein
MECFRFFSVLEAHHDVIRISNHDHGSPRLLSASVFTPQIKYIVQVNIGKKRRNHRSLRATFAQGQPHTLIQHSCFQPFSDEAKDPFIRDTMS